MPTILCEVCGAPFQVRPYRAKTARFCSKRCGGSWHCRNRLNTGSKPHMLGNKYGQGKRPTNAFVSEAVRGERNLRWTERLKLTCAFCKQPFEAIPWVVRQNNNKALFCSVQCRSRYRSVFLSGPNAADWKGGKTTYRGPDWPEARTRVIVEQRGFCAHCSVFKGKRLPVHHIKPFRDFLTSREANQRGNLIGLCPRCHMRMENGKAPLGPVLSLPVPP